MNASISEAPPRWDRRGMPHRGWSYLRCVDHGRPDFQCQACGNEHVRYEHVLSHAAVGELSTGVQCAGHLTGDTMAAHEHEGAFRRAAAQRRRAAERRTRMLAEWFSPQSWRVDPAFTDLARPLVRLVRRIRGVELSVTRWGAEQWTVTAGGTASPYTYRSERDALQACLFWALRKGLV